MYRPNLTKYYLAVFLIALSSVSAVANEALKEEDASAMKPALKRLLHSKAMEFHWSDEQHRVATANPTQGYDALIDQNGMYITTRECGWQINSQLLSYGRSGELHTEECGNLAFERHKLHVEKPGLTVEYLNSGIGIRQNFIFTEEPHGNDFLQVDLAFQSVLNARLLEEQVLAWFTNENEQVFSYQDLRVWDARGRKLNAWMSLRHENGIDVLSLLVDDAQAVYPVTVDPVSTVPNRLIQGTQNGMEFGISVSSAGDVNGDGFSDVIVGAWKAANGQSGEGLAFIYHGSETGIGTTHDAMLEINQNNAEFGCSVSTAGDINGDGYADVIVGARRWENSGSTASEGAAFLFYGSPTGVSATYDELLERNVGNSFMGSNVACAGDIDNDGYSDLIVGAYLAALPTTQEGVAYIYQGSPTGMIFRHRLDGNHGGAHFSRSVSSAGDLNGDGHSDIVIGASQYDNLGLNDGRVFIYYGNVNMLGGGGTFPGPSLSLDGSGQTSSAFGWSVTCASDLNGDGYSDLAVGAYRDANGQSNEGRVYVYHGSSAGLITAPVAILESNQIGAWMGRSISNVGDMNGDGYGDLAIGIPLQDQGQTDEGVVHIHFGSASGISTTRNILLQVNNAGANFGEAVRGAGDVNGDGYSDIIVGARLYGSTGAAAIFHGGGYNIPVTPSTDELGAAASDQLGGAVASAGDVNGDGFSDMLISAPNASLGQANEGVVRYYQTGLTGLNPTPTEIQRNVANGQFGKAISTAGDVNGDGYSDVIIGAPGVGSGGAAYLYYGSPAGLPGSPNRTLSSSIAGADFGASVAAAGDINSDGYADVLVGAPNSGNAYLYLGSPSGTSSSPAETLSSTGTFGWAVSSSGDVNGDGYSDIAISDPFNGNGIVRVYHGSQSGLVTPFASELSHSFANAEYGYSISAAGDLDADGYFDLVVGAPGLSNGHSNEGALFAQYGSPVGLTSGSNDRFESNSTNARKGHSVDEAGDVNGDGYADVIAGAPDMTNGQTNEGYVFLYLGRSTGLASAGRRLVQSNVADMHFGETVAGLGDSDGDGFSEVIVGSPQLSSTLPQQGGFRVFKGNDARGLTRTTRQYQANLTSPLATNSMDFSDPNHFGIGHLAFNPTQRSDGRLHWEIAFQGGAWAGNPITNNVIGTDTSATWTDLGTNGVEIKELIFKKPGEIRYKWRVRVEYEMAKAFDGQRYGRWYYGFSSQHSDIGVLPVELLSFTAEQLELSNELRWLTASESDLSKFVIERADQDLDFAPIGEKEAIGGVQTTTYGFTDNAPLNGTSFYRLKMEDNSGQTEFSQILVLERSIAELQLFPNPATETLMLTGLTSPTSFDILDARGKLLKRSLALHSSTIDISFLPSGYYTLVIHRNDSQTPTDRLTFVKR